MPEYTITEEQEAKANRMADIWDERAQIYYDTQRIGLTPVGHCKTKEEAESAGTIAKNIRKAINFLILGIGIPIDYARMQQACTDLETLQSSLPGT